ncbi:GspH/FimT family pseudopilin [Azoarcus sp. PA01]|nr:GspH/FimT family pseudopilin [Azoarcus sp. PA01]
MNRRPRSSSPAGYRHRSFRGFTLVEILVALTIAATLFAVAPVVLDRAYETMQYRATLRTLLTGLNAARAEAVRSGRTTTFDVDLQTRRFGVDARFDSELPSDLDVRVVVAQGEIRPGGQAAIRFYPEGGATGGSVELIRPSGAGVRLRVDWLLGRVTQEPLGT